MNLKISMESHSSAEREGRRVQVQEVETRQPRRTEDRRREVENVISLLVDDEDNRKKNKKDMTALKKVRKSS